MERYRDLFKGVKLNLHKIDIADRDKFAAAFGLVADVLMYYPHGVYYPIFIDAQMVNVKLTPYKDGYKLAIPTPAGTKTHISHNTLDYFATAVDRSKEIAENSEVGSFAASASTPVLAHSVTSSSLIPAIL